MNRSHLLGAVCACATNFFIVTPATAATINLSYQFDLDGGISQVEIGGAGSGTSIYRTLLDTSQSFTLVDGDTVNIDVSFLNNKALLISDNAGSISTGLENMILEMPLAGLGVNFADAAIDITGYSGDVNGTQFSSLMLGANGGIFPGAGGNITDTSLVMTNLSVSFTVLSGIPTSATFDSVRLAVTTGTVANVVVSAVPVPAAFWLFSSGLLGFISVAWKKTGNKN